MAAPSPSPPPQSVQPVSWLNAKEACEILGIAQSTLYEQKKRYGARRHNGAYEFNSVLVYAAARDRQAAALERQRRENADGTAARIVFAALKEGKTAIEIVIEHGITPDVVEQLQESYARLCRAEESAKSK